MTHFTSRPTAVTIMSLTKALFCDFCVILMIGLTGVVADGKVTNITSSANDTAKGNCTCGGFPAIALEVDSQPLLAQSPGLVVNCDDEGENTCKSLCIALATTAKAKGPEVLCTRLINAEELKLSAFSKICDRPWMYADMTADQPLCCANSKVKTCASVEQANSTDIVDAKTIM